MESGSVDALAQRHPLAAVRAARGWSYRDLAEAVAVQSRTLGVPMAARREKAWRWENWGVVPDADSQRALAMALGVSPGRVGVRPWPSWLPTGTELPTNLAWTPEGTLVALRELLADVGEDRRAFAVAGAAVWVDVVAVWGSGVGPGTAPGPGADREGGADGHVGAWLRMHEATLPWLLRAAQIADPLVLRRKLDADLRLIVDLLGVTKAGGPLYQAAAKIALLAGRRCLRVGLHGPAQRYLITALRCAHSAGDECLGAVILGVIGRHLALTGDAATAQRVRALAGDVKVRGRGVAAAA